MNSPVIFDTVVWGLVMATWSILSSRVMAWPGSSVVPQQKPGLKAICAPCTSTSALHSSWFQLPLKLPRR